MIGEIEEMEHFETAPGSAEVIEATGIQAHQDLHQFREDQQKMLAEIRENQKQLQKKMEDSICKGLEGITKIRFGAQAREYFEDTQREREKMRAETLEQISTAAKETTLKTLQVLSTHQESQQQHHKDGMEWMKQIFTKQMTEMMGDNNNRLIDSIENSQKKLMVTIADSMQTLASTMGGLTNSVGATQENMTHGMTSAIQDMSIMISSAMKELKITSIAKETPEPPLVGGGSSSVPISGLKTEISTQQKQSSNNRTRKPHQSASTDSSSDEECQPGIEFSDSDEETTQSINSAKARS